MGLYDYTLYSVIQRNAKVHKDRVAWICGEERISNRQFLDKIDHVACGLMNAGLKKGDRLGVVAQNSMEYIYLYGAAAKIGAVMLPINWRLKPEEIEYIVSDGAPKIIFAGSDFYELVDSLIPKFRFIEKQYAMQQAGAGFAAFSELMANDGNCPELDVRSDDAYVIIHTAAVAGRPRGVTLSHHNLLTANMQCMCIWNITHEDCHLCMLPLFHIAALGTALNIMQAGGRNVVLPKFDPEMALKHIQNDKVSVLIEFPPMLTTLLDKNQELKYDLSSLRIVGGLDFPETVKRFEEETGGTFWTAYGQSETSGLVSFAPYFERVGSAGLPAYMAEVSIVNGAGEFVKPGTPGEIVVRGPMVFKGYWNLDKDNEYIFRNGWHHTGDMGRFDEDGYLWYAGRMPEKELIKPGGENVYPAEVENAVLEHPLVEEVSVIGVPDKQWGEAIKAVCVLKRGACLEESELIEFVATKIARFKKPKYVVFVSELPKAKGGAIDRSRVKEQYGQP